jgi:uncharacterized protein YdhG (YjbR/CyaY superfamily)
MKTSQESPTDIEGYITAFPAEIQEILQKIRATIRKAAPRAQETIKYGMPTYALDGNLVHFAAFKKHIGLFPPVKSDAEFRRAVAAYEGPKGNLRFPLDEPIPYELISRMVKIRVKETLAKAESKRTKR